MFRFLNRIVWLLFSLILMNGCGAKPVLEPVTTDSPRPSPTMQLAEFITSVPVTASPTSTSTPRPTPGPTATPRPTVTPNPMTMARQRPATINPLTGLPVDNPAILRRRPFMVRIGNDPVARPQVGLNQADLVYEELVEWWITRFTAVYLTHDPRLIGPIRSARLINTQLTPQYQAALIHSGGSDPIRWALAQLDIVDLDEFFTPQPYIYRDSENWATRLAFDATLAREYLADENLEAAVKLRGFLFGDTLATNFEPAQEVIIPYPAKTSQAKWQYDPQSGLYLRWITDQPLTTEAGQQITTTNVILYFAPHQTTNIVEDSTGATSVRTLINGQGPAWLLRDGQLLKGQWQTNGEETPWFTFDNGDPMLLKPGRSWIQVVPLDYQIKVDGQWYGLEKDEDEAHQTTNLE